MDIPVFTGTHADFLVIVSTCFSLTPVCTMSHIRPFHPGLHHGIIFHFFITSSVFALGCQLISLAWTCHLVTTPPCGLFLTWSLHLIFTVGLSPCFHTGLNTLSLLLAYHIIITLGISPCLLPVYLTLHATLSSPWHLTCCHFTIQTSKKSFAAPCRKLPFHFIFYLYPGHFALPSSWAHHLVFTMCMPPCNHPGHIMLPSPWAHHVAITLGTSCCHHPGQLPPCLHSGMYTVSDVTQFWWWSLSISVILTARWNLSPLFVQLAFWDGQGVRV